MIGDIFLCAGVGVILFGLYGALSWGEEYEGLAAFMFVIGVVMTTISFVAITEDKESTEAPAPAIEYCTVINNYHEADGTVLRTTETVPCEELVEGNS